MSERSPEEVVRELLERISAALELEATVDVRREGELITGTLEGDDLGLFIGRHGQTIEAVQHLAQRILIAGAAEAPARVVIDAAGYRARREEALRQQADEAAEDALRFDRPVALSPMAASERKIVHTHLAERGDVTTHSEGVEPERHLVVAPAD